MKFYAIEPYISTIYNLIITVKKYFLGESDMNKRYKRKGGLEKKHE